MNKLLTILALLLYVSPVYALDIRAFMSQFPEAEHVEVSVVPNGYFRMIGMGDGVMGMYLPFKEHIYLNRSYSGLEDTLCHEVAHYYWDKEMTETERLTYYYMYLQNRVTTTPQSMLSVQENFAEMFVAAKCNSWRGVKYPRRRIPRIMRSRQYNFVKNL
jgi:hypothetical protein